VQVRERNVETLDARRQRVLARVRRPWWVRHGELVRYGLAFVAYVGLGLVFTEVLSSWIFGVGFLVVFAWGVPALWRRLR
jgi:hypothetical protein